jgi:hypothetical protein
MARTELEEEAQEESVYVVRLGPFLDESDEVVTPTAFTWTLSTLDGTVINSRDNVSVVGASTITLLLTGNDLSILEGEAVKQRDSKVKRLITFAATYFSDLGAGLVLRDELVFVVNAMVKVT